MNIFYVYRYIRLDTNTPFYVGKGKNKRSTKISDHNSYCRAIAKKYGMRIDFISKNLTEKQAFDKEVEFIRIYKNAGYCEANLTLGGEGSVPTEETRKKMSLSRKGKPVHPNCLAAAIKANKGKHLSAKTIKKLSKSLGGRKLSEEHKAKISKSCMGNILSNESKEKISKALMGRKFSKKWRKKLSISHKNLPLLYNSKEVIDISSGFVWKSAKEASTVYGIKHSTLKGYLNGNYTNKTMLRYIETLL